MERSAFLVVALGRRKIESLADRDVVGEKVARHGLIETGIPGIERHDVNDASTAIHADNERLNPLQWHQQQERCATRHSTDPTSSGDAPGDSGAALSIGYTIVIPRGGLLEITHERLFYGR